MLIVLPPSESKRPPPDAGSPVALETLSFPELNPLRSHILAALVETSGRPDAFSRLRVGPALVADVMRNIDILELPTLPALEIYTGSLHAGLDAATFSAAGARRAATVLVVVSALWGALHPMDRIPPYRLDVCSHLVGMDRLEQSWRTVLPGVLAEAAGAHGVVLDLRSPSFRALGVPTDLHDRTVMLHVRQRAAGGHWVGDVVAKRIRGQAARFLIESDAEPDDPVQLAALLGECWPLDLRPPERGNDPWRISIQPDA